MPRPAEREFTTCLVPQTLANGAGINTFGLPSAASINNNGANVGRVIQLAAKIVF